MMRVCAERSSQQIVQVGRYGEIVPVGYSKTLAAAMVRVFEGQSPKIDLEC
jgi:hypothetical protein